MRRIQKMLAGVFLGSILLGGIGTGAALVEYASFSYGGEKQIGEENLVTKTLDFAFEPGQGMIRIVRDGDGMQGGIIEDESVPEGIIRYVVTYNEKLVEPYLAFEEADTCGAAEETWVDGENEEAGRQAGTGEGEAQGFLHLSCYHTGKDLEVFMECKDMFLQEFREKKISHYEAVYVTKVEILVNPATAPYVDGGSVTEMILASGELGS